MEHSLWSKVYFQLPLSKEDNDWFNGMLLV